MFHTLFGERGANGGTDGRTCERLSRSDNHFGPRERAFVMEILLMCDVPFVHK